MKITMRFVGIYGGALDYHSIGHGFAYALFVFIAVGESSSRNAGKKASWQCRTMKHAEVSMLSSFNNFEITHQHFCYV